MTKRSFLTSSASIAFACVSLSVPVMAQDEPGAESDASANDEIVVTAARLRGQVDTDIAPVLELNEADIAAYGAGSIDDLLAAIEPQTSSNRGRDGQPIFLVNGVRIGSFREFRSYPPEAIQKVEVLPEEVALKFGFAPTRRVVNFILKDNYSALTAELEYEQPDRGGYSFNEQELTWLKIAGGGRLNFNLEREDTSSLTEAERDIIQTQSSIPDIATDPDPAAFRTLVADSVSYEATANYARAFIESGSSISVNATYEREESESLSGLDSVLFADGDTGVLRTFNADDPLARRSVSDSFSTAGSYNRPVGTYTLTATADATYTDAITRIDERADTQQVVADAEAGLFDIRGPLPTIASGGVATAESQTLRLDSKATLRGSPLFLPAGELQTTFDVGYVYNRIESEDTRADTAIALDRSNLSAGINVTVPISSERENFLANAGTINLNGNFGVNEVSDFGTLLNWSAGLSWEPLDGLDLQMTYTWRETQPILSQLGNPQIVDLNVPVFDFTNNETVLVTRITGGNPDLLAETQSDWSFSANWRLPFLDNARVNLNYSTNNSDNVSSSFPFLTPEIEAAFPDRITRAGSGALTGLDLRPVDFLSSRSQRISVGVNYRGSIGPEPERRGPPEEGAGRTGVANADGAVRDRAGGRAGNGGERFAALREKLCANDGEEFLRRLIASVENGEPMDELPGFDPAGAQRLLDRLKSDDGTIDEERLAAFRTRICDSAAGEGRTDGAERAERGGSGRGGGGRGGGGRGGNRGAGSFLGGNTDDRARFFVNFNHSVELDRDIVIAPEGPVLDLLDGDSLTSTGTPANISRLEAGLFKGGYGLRLSGSYTGTARINGSGLPGSTNLFIDDLARFDIRVFADLGEVLNRDDGVFKGMRLSFKVDNVFDGRRLVTDGNGDTPINFQPFLIDPVGRYVGVDLRKLF